ncbi:MAG TPA: CPBP family intramembrane glutamic endopeptidase [Terriglobales bacterium]|jgi:membrane protease YdiL (CAAX protease family)|nr:CPBP family intramembrane glutamic endopeptidase [Terriglobales bacterium]
MNRSAENAAEAVVSPKSAGSGGGQVAGWRQSKWLAVAELAVVVLIYIADAHHLIFFSKTPYLLAFGWISLRVRGLRWRDVGLTRYRNWGRTLLLGVGAGLLMEVIELGVTQPFLVRVLGKPPDLSEFHALHGNWKFLAVVIVLAWTLAAFGEEMVYRGYLMNRVADLFHRTRAAWVVSLLVVHIGFGFSHIYQGWIGVIDEGLMGLLLGLIYLRSGRNLAVPIVAHGVADTVDFLLIFLGKFPGM